MNQQTNLRWGLVLLLAVLGLVRPLSSIAGVYGSQGEDSWAPVLVTGAVSAVWMGVVVAVRAPNPLLTLTAAGGMYGVFGILL